MKKLIIISCVCLLVNCSKSDAYPNENNPSDVVSGKRIVSLLNSPNYVVKYHFGTNVHSILESNSINTGGKLGSSYSGIPRPEDTKSWGKIFKHLSWFGFNWIRLGYEHNDIQYEKGKYAWDNLLETEKTVNYKNMIHFLDWAEENNIHVLLQEFAQATNWNCIPGQLIGHSAPNDLEAWATGYVELVKHLIYDKGYTCITMLNISNEPDNWWDWWKGRDIVEGYKIVREKLDAENIDLPLAGPEKMSGGSFTANWQRCKPYIDIFETHNYDDSHDNKIAFRPIDEPNIPVIWGEYAGGDNRAYWWNLWQAKWQVGGYNNGIDGFARWNFLNTNNIDGNFSYIITWNNNTNSIATTDFFKQPNLYHIDGLISRFVPRQSAVMTTMCNDDKLITSVFKTPNGNYTILVVSQLEEESDVNIELQGLEKSICLYKYEINKSHEDRSDVDLSTGKTIMLNADAEKFTDRILPWSLVVYSTFNISMDENGVVEDGKEFNIDNILIPLESNPVVVDDRDKKIVYGDGFITKNDSGCHMRRLQYNKTKGAKYEFAFEGEGFRLYGQQDSHSGLSNVYVNDKFVGYASSYAPVGRDQIMIFDSGQLSKGVYHVRVVNEFTKSVTSSDTYTNIDAIAFTTADAKLIELTK